jgi:hypothetical protein
MLVFVDFVELVVHVYDFVATANGPLRRARVADGFGCVLQSCPLDRKTTPTLSTYACRHVFAQRKVLRTPDPQSGDQAGRHLPSWRGRHVKIGHVIIPSMLPTGFIT